jgi:APA family basic amino acid/polyamine antiporter
MTQPTENAGFVRGLNLFDATMLVIGSMIGSGIFIVSADMARLINSPGWLLVAWAVTAVLTILAAVSYGELAVMLPHAGGVYVFLREAYSPLWGFLYGWTLFAVIQTGTIAAVAVGFARFTSVLLPGISESNYLIAPIHVSTGYAFSLSTAQLVGIAVIVLLTWTNSREGFGHRGPDPGWIVPGPQRGGDPGQFHRALRSGRVRSRAGRCRRYGVRTDRGHRRCAIGLAVFGRRVA